MALWFCQMSVPVGGTVILRHLDTILHVLWRGMMEQYSTQGLHTPSTVVSRDYVGAGLNTSQTHQYFWKAFQ